MASPSGAKTGTVFIASIVFGIAAAFLSVMYLKSKEAALIASLAGDEETLVAVVVAKQDLSKGIKLKAADFAVRQIPGNYVHPSAVKPGEFENYIGRFIVEDISRGKSLLTSFVDETFPVDFSDLVKKDRRAITIQIDEPQSIAGMLRPGNRVDLFVNIGTRVIGYSATSDLPPGLEEAALQAANSAGVGELPPELLQTVAGKKANDVILPVLQDVLVLATGREAYQDYLDRLGLPQRRQSNTFTSITIDVSPKQAALILMAEDQGDLLGILRNRHDRGGADFTGITALDLLNNANEMKKAAALQKAAAAAGATIDENGNWVTADGKVINKEDISISANGTVTTKGGQLLGAKGITVNENGEYVDENGNVIPEDQLVFNADGTVTTKDELMKAAGYTINENGDYVDKDGNVVSADDIQVLANGTVMTKDGKVLSGPKVTVNKDGFIIAEDGTVMTADGKVLAGVTVDENGNVIAPDGSIMKDANLIVDADGTVRDSNGNVIAGVSGSSLPPTFGEDEIELKIPEMPTWVALVLGGSGKDGVATTNTIKVEPVAAEFPIAPPATEQQP
ncbi:MAG: Flp pilus assembly protein CpaB [Proteobacteria bacterium]|nr:Flp pilus assembly protein CpaB [Pseudomonadota bacterium]NOG59736.1 Flp pilus assembly protein CpaB [Pseudomonadota bacterium]